MADVNKSIDDALTSLRPYQSPLSDADKALVMQGWNKALAFRSMFMEGLLIHWRLLCANYEIGTEEDGDAMTKVERGEDPIATCLKVRLLDADEILVGLIDVAIRSLCPHTQKVEREAYRALRDEGILGRASGDLKLECVTQQEYLDLLARCGVQPQYWVLFVTSFEWAMETHSPYAKDDDLDDLKRACSSAVLRAIAQTVSIPAIQAYRRLKSLLTLPVPILIVDRWNAFNQADKANFGEVFYRNLLGDFPELLDYFRRTDMDSLAMHQSMALDLIFNYIKDFGNPLSPLRKRLEHLAEIHRRMQVPTYTYPLVGATLVKTLLPFFDDKDKEGVTGALKLLYSEVMSLVYYPMLRQEKLIAKAHEFYQQIKVEFGWSEHTYEKRMIEIEHEIASTGTYVQTSQEVEMGARLAWRNSAKCVGRIAWNTLKLRDRRHIESPADIFEDVRHHLFEATAGTNIQSVMTVYKPKSPNQALGVRWWSSQLVRYAAYKDPFTGKILGDPANLELTNYLIDHKRWTPPDEPTAFDVLPLVLKVPGKKRPYVHELPKDCLFEVPLEHPHIPGITELGLRWTTVPALTTLRMNLGGVEYQNMPFNGWFLSTEIVRNLMERYDAGPSVAKVMKLDIDKDPMWRQDVSVELERAVIHSFQKHGFTIVDPMTVGKSFCTHVLRERENFGRECPGQWSWIGGLLGPTNPTWHLEMRDFLVEPQYLYSSESMLLHTYLTEGDETSVAATEVTNGDLSVTTSTSSSKLPKVLILYGSETGNAEAAARRLKRELHLLKPLIMELNEAMGLEVAQKRNITHVLAICSTFGKGEPPSNAAEFFKTEIEPTKAETAYAVLAIGSTAYPDFCQAGLQLDRKLQEAGMRAIATITKADDSAGAEAAIDSWIQIVSNLLLPAYLRQELEMSVDSAASEPLVHRINWLNSSGEVVPATTTNLSRCLSNHELLEGCKDRSTKQITFEALATYETGDHLAVHPMNSDEMVHRFVVCFEDELSKAAAEGGNNGGNALEWIMDKRFEIVAEQGTDSESADVFFPTPTTLVELLKSKVDMTLKGKDVVALLDLITPIVSPMAEGGVELPPELSRLLSYDGEDRTEAVDDFLACYPNIVEFMERNRGVLFEGNNRLRLAEVLVILPRLQPRFYSISSSSLLNPDQITLTVGVLNTETSKGVAIHGVCSNYLAGLAGGVDSALVSVHQSTFRLPRDASAPCIMVGTGTGLSPLIGFLQERVAEKRKGVDVGTVDLFFGCRHEDEFIYKDLILELGRDGLLNLHLALSRSKSRPKQYVQDAIIELGERAAKLLMEPTVHYYVCGDARMADCCSEAFVTVLRQHCQMSRISAVQHLKTMRLEGRWQTDVWGIVQHFEEAKRANIRCKKMAAKLWMEHFQSNLDN